jgi:membrane fusion protein, multidrug efflux system
MRTVLIALVLVVAWGCSEEKKGGAPQGRRGAMEFPVEVQPVEIRDVEYEIRADGTVDVFERVQVTARVAGVVEKVAFREGDTVKAGAVLATIDPARYDLAARQAGASVDRARSALEDAEAGLARRTKADSASPGLIPAEEIASWETKVEQAKADVSEKEITAQRARLDRKDAYVRAPVAGIVQSRDATTGMYAQPGTLLATLVQREPLLVRFDVDETEAARVVSGAVVRFTVEGDGREWEAKVSHVAEVADPKSRLVRVTAEVTSKERAALRAGGFAQVVVPVGGTVKAPVIPELAIRPSERGFLVFTVVDGVAQEKVVELGLRTPDGKVEVKKGLGAGDQLVVRGAEALREGAKVKVTP